MLMQACKKANCSCRDDGCKHSKKHTAFSACKTHNPACPACVPVADKVHLSRQQLQVVECCKLKGSITTARACGLKPAIYRLSERIRELKAIGYTFRKFREDNKFRKSPEEPYTWRVRYYLTSEPS